MRDSILFFMLTHRAKYFTRFYSVFLFLIAPFIAWFSLQIVAPAPGFLTSEISFNLLIAALAFSLFILFLSAYVTMDCRRDIPFMRIDDVVVARAFYALVAFALGLAASFAGYCLDLSYIALVLFFALRDFHSKRSLFYLRASILICLVCTAVADSDLLLEILLTSAQNWLTQWLMVASVYCVLDCMSLNSDRLSKEHRLLTGC